jgi:hypothetical protein
MPQKIETGSSLEKLMPPKCVRLQDVFRVQSATLHAIHLLAKIPDHTGGELVSQARSVLTYAMSPESTRQPNPQIESEVDFMTRAICGACAETGVDDSTAAEILNMRYDAMLRRLMFSLGLPAYEDNPGIPVDPDVADEQIRWGIDRVIAHQAAGVLTTSS